MAIAMPASDPRVDVLIVGAGMAGLGAAMDLQRAGRRVLLQAAAGWLGAGIKTFQVHAWRFSKPLRVEPGRCLYLNDSPPLILAGEAFAGPRVEGAALSGWAAANAILQPRP